MLQFSIGTIEKLLIWIVGLRMVRKSVVFISLFPMVFSFANRNDGQVIKFNRHIRPILSDKCFTCHGPDEGQRVSDLRLDSREGLNQVLMPGNPDSSELVRRIESLDGNERMPPEHSKMVLTADETTNIRKWVEQGAQWEQHWSLVPLARVDTVSLPKPKNHQVVFNPIDAFVLTRLEQEELTFSPAASREALLRRVTLDLTGVAPTLEELDDYLADVSTDSYEKAVDRLLASPRFGERMASQWLDLARYSDTYGYQVDHDRFVWPWRDWVVRAFNSNLPFDQFAREQIAGDLLPNPTSDQILATAFNRLHSQKVEGGSIEEEFRVEYVADRVNTFGTAFLGLTVECARCHDHKFDPLTMDEYYQLFAFFNNIDEAGLYSFFDPSSVPTPTLTLLEPSQAESYEVLNQRVDEAEQALRHLVDSLNAFESNKVKPSHNSAAVNSNDASPLEPSIEKAFENWLRDGSARNVLAEKEQARLKLTSRIDLNAIGGNQLIQRDDGKVEILLTGDDEIKIDGGKFAREQPFSVVARIRIPASTDNLPIDRAVIFHCSRAWTDSASRGYQLLIEDGRLSAALIHFWPGNAISVKTVETIPADQWLDVVMTYDGSSSAKGLKIYVNGKPQTTSIVRDQLNRTILGNGTDQLIIGGRFRDKGFKDGRISHFHFEDVELTEIEIAQLHDGKSLVDLLERVDVRINESDQARLRQYFAARHDKEIEVARKNLQNTRQELNKFEDGLPEIMVMRERPGLRKTFRLERGAYDSPEYEVIANTPAMLPLIKVEQHEIPNRLDLADWLIDENHPLTARVAVNQYWQMLFGSGLVRTPEDFGSQSMPPTHLELLDWLASDFQRDWDIKRCLKQMVLSSTYRQSSSAGRALHTRDPDNLLLARGAMFRLSAEIVRDNLLLQSGLLVEQIGGPPVRPYDLELAFSPVQRDSGAALYRRSLYTYWRRTSLSPAMIVLDAPSRDVCTVNRDRTSTPLQGLLLLNGTQFVEAARNLSEKAIMNHQSDRSSIAKMLFRSLTSRLPDDRELNVLVRLYEQQHQRYSTEPSLADELTSVGESKSTLENRIELAAWTTVASTLMNLEEVVFQH